MRRAWTTRDIPAPAEAVWEVLTDPERWPDWGPSVRAVDLQAPRLALGARGRVQTAARVWAPFEITRFDDGRAWSWAVAGLPATDHSVESLGASSCRAGFGVPWVAAPYLSICRVALSRIERLVRQAD